VFVSSQAPLQGDQEMILSDTLSQQMAGAADEQASIRGDQEIIELPRSS
jgi:hypothetical protein